MMTGRSLGILALFASMLLGASAHADYLAMSGAELYRRFCASCHGEQGRGDGPVAAAFKTEMPDLRLITRRHGGKFPSDQIERIIDGRYTLLAHGTRNMPVWGREFFNNEPGNPDAERATQLMISRLLEYVQTLQRPVAKEATAK